jgi:NDP-sugar pyrophosphorylase family protein
MPNTWGMILAAGLGTRLRPLTYVTPKPQLDLGGKPIIYHLLDHMLRAGIKDVIINLHYLADKLTTCLNDYPNKLRIHTVYEPNILGTAGAVINAINKFNLENKQLLVMHGDIVFDYDIKNVLSQNNFCTLLCVKEKFIEGYEGSVNIDKNGFITRLGAFFNSDKPYESKNFFTGIQLFSPSALKNLANLKAESLVKDVYPQWIEQNLDIKAITGDFYYNDLGDIKRLNQANLIMLEKYANK